MPNKKRKRSRSTQKKAILVPAVRKTKSTSAYSNLLADIKSRVRNARLRAAVAANRELIVLYWQIGCEILRRQKEEGWGAKVIDRLSRDLRSAFPEMKGFSSRNLKYMRALADAFSDPAFVQEVLAQITWYHAITLIDKIADAAIRDWYIHQTIEQGWSRNVLVLQIDSKAHKRQGKAITNFSVALPSPQSDLANNLLKDPYVFDFLTIGEGAQERHLQAGLLEHLRDFLVELGVGFAFVGSRYQLDVDGKEYFLDLLFYHLKLRSFVVIDLKIGAFEPEHAGKMNFYLSAIDDLLRRPGDQPSIGLILCRSSNRLVVEYALRDQGKPIGVARWALHHKALPKELRDSLPSVQQIEEELARREQSPPGESE